MVRFDLSVPAPQEMSRDELVVVVARQAGQLAERAEELHERSMALAEETGSKPSYGAALNGRAIARRLTGQLDEAAGFADRARVIYHDAGLISGEALAFANLGFIAERQGRVDEAAAFHQQSLALARRLGEPLRVALAVEGLAGANLLVGLLNLVPGLPLDGGRVLKAAVWGLTGNVHRGTIVAG